MTLKKSITLTSMALLTALIGYHVIARAFPTQSTDTARAPVPVVTMPITLQHSYQEWRSFTGRAVAGRTSPLGFELGGTVKDVFVDIGSPVQKGALLAQLDIARLEANQKRLEAELAAAEATVTLAEKTLTRIKETYAQGHMSAQRLDEAVASKAQAIANKHTLEAALAALKVDLEKSTITAPFDGVITDRFADEGRILAAGSPLLTLVETKALEAHIGLSAPIAATLEKGTDFRLLTATRDDIAAPRLRHILPVIEGQTRTRLAVLSLPDGVARDGDLITLLIKDEKKATGAWVPLRALSADVRGLWRLNKVTKDDKGQLHVGFEAVQILYTTGRNAYVTGTLSDGDQIIAAGVERLAAGERVTIVREAPPLSPATHPVAVKADQ